jgi:hypoxanthine-guanine phosphoribosyltransferase
MCCVSTIQLLGDVPAGLTGRPLLLVDDIVDTGRSLSYAAAELSRCGERQALDMRVARQAAAAAGRGCARLRRLRDPRHVVGYGTDFAEKYRHLPYIGVVE